MSALVASVWGMQVLFGLFAAMHYILSFFLHSTNTNVQAIWDRTDLHLYRNDVVANAFMVGHMMGGVLLMVVGPMQLIPAVRREKLSWHRWMGRVYLLAAVIASTCATIWTLVWRTSRCNLHEDLGNVILGIAVFVCTLQTFRYVRAGQLQLHRLWAWRLYASVLAAPLYRLYAAVYGAILIYTPWNGSLWIENGLFYALVIPNLMVVQLLWWRQLNQQQEQQQQHAEDLNDWREQEGTSKTDSHSRLSKLLLLKVHPTWIWTIIAFLLVTTGIVGFYVWLPAIVGFEVSTITEQLYHDFC